MICFRHTREMIQKLESAGLGYHVSADETEDELGNAYDGEQMQSPQVNIMWSCTNFQAATF